ncbi:MAG TPA: isoamylase early set domain-containing protein [Planctomycetota bacterium]
MAKLTPKAAAPKPAVVAKAPVSPLKNVSIAARLDGAREVLVTGDFTNWNGSAVPLSRTTDGTWTATLKLAPGEYQYRLLVDGQWRDHAEAPRRVPNPFGTENCVLTVA